jgi:hypothetical protein
MRYLHFAIRQVPCSNVRTLFQRWRWMAFYSAAMTTLYAAANAPNDKST